jgi:hypothetical protein
VSHTKYPPTIRFGSLSDNEFCIKNKFISRRQFVIIEETQRNTHKSEIQGNLIMEPENLLHRVGKDKRNISAQQETISVFYLVCLSPSNYTALLYPERT